MRQTAISFVLIPLVMVAYGANAGSYGPERPTSSRRDMLEIVDGVDISKDRFPYIASLHARGSKRQYCMGVLVAPRWVLTAAHCVDGSLPFGDGRPLIYIKSKKCKTIRRFLNPDRQADPVNGPDIALLKMDKPARKVPPVRVPNSPLNLALNDTLWSVGWPLNGFTGRPSKIIQMGGVNIVRNEKCKEAYPNTTINEANVCVGGTSVNACPGDDGGPLLLLDSPKDAIENGIPTLDRVVATLSVVPQPCREGNKPEVHTRVDNLAEWITSVTGFVAPTPSVSDALFELMNGDAAAAANIIIQLALLDDGAESLTDVAIGALNRGLGTVAKEAFLLAMQVGGENVSDAAEGAVDILTRSEEDLSEATPESPGLKTRPLPRNDCDSGIPFEKLACLLENDSGP